MQTIETPTMAVPMPEAQSNTSASLSAPIAAALLPFERERGVYAIHVTRDVAHAIVPVGNDVLRTRRIEQVFQVLADAGVPIFLIKMHRTVVTFAFAGSDTERAVAALHEAELSARTRRELALIAIRAASMRDMSGIMVDISDSLYQAGAHLYETGDSHNSVQCLVDEGKAEAAVLQLCAAFHLEENDCRESLLEARGGA